jgi:hypothetical protein
MESSTGFVGHLRVLCVRREDLKHQRDRTCSGSGRPNQMPSPAAGLTVGLDERGRNWGAVVAVMPDGVVPDGAAGSR